MILSGAEIRQAVRSGEMGITPFDDRLVKRNSYLLRLSGPFRRLEGDEVVDTADPPESFRRAEGTVEDGDSVVLTPDTLVLAGTHERVGLAPPSLVGLLSGISNVARLGVQVHATSQLVNAGFAYGDPSPLVLELCTVGGAAAYASTGGAPPVCHLVLARLSVPATGSVPSARTGQRGTDPSRLLEQFGTSTRTPARCPGNQVRAVLPVVWDRGGMTIALDTPDIERLAAAGGTRCGTGRRK
ncbi:hypothetical protein GTV15_09810, partial [Streptomyces sp. SID7803]|nr:hypothetical protein [Streptomyces sp. SID7803]